MIKKDYSLIFSDEKALERFKSFLATEEIFSLEISSVNVEKVMENVSVEKKKCTVCEEEKSVDSFAKDSQRKDGRRPSCKLCTKKKLVKKAIDLRIKLAAEIQGITIEEAREQEKQKILTGSNS